MKKVPLNKLLKKQGSRINFKKSIDFMNFALDTNYIYHFNWFGVKLIQFPSDIMMLQNIIYDSKPDVIIECGVAHGGSLIFYSSMLRLLGKKNYKVIGIDILIKKKNKRKIKLNPLSKEVVLIEKSSTSPELKSILKKYLKPNKKIMVVLDSNHTHQHVLDELNFYSSYIKKNQFIVVLDTNIEFIASRHINKGRAFKKGNSPYTAAKQFLKTNKKFKNIKKYENMAMVSSAYNGILKRII
tara:strand:- start:331 stop:1053 length:723 start_codon:yes stop_codon:yes gene_type:complete